MRIQSVRFAALAATVSACLFSGSTGIGFDFIRLTQAAEQNTGTAGGLGGGGAGLGASKTQSGSGPIPGSAKSSTLTDANSRAVDLTTGVGAAGSEAGEGAGSAVGFGSGSVLGQSDRAAGTGSGESDGDPPARDNAASNEAQSQSMSATAAAAETDAAPVNAPEKPSVPEIVGNGFFNQKIALQLPEFRGLEPRIALSYSSARKARLGGLYQGWLGYAWGIDGFDVIERASPGNGYPAYNSSDIYLLNGEELVTCSSGMTAASCSAGGSHVTEVENFKRIKFDAAANTWTVTDRDGTRSLFRSVQAVSGSNPTAGTPSYDLERNGRFLLSEVTDTNGNTVNYAYTCPESPVCYPSRITYGGGAVISFSYQNRPDHIVMANGLTLSYTTKRLITIAVNAGGALRSAYKLTYDQAPLSNASRLIKVEQYGSDATVSGGTVSGPSVRTIRQMAYDDVTFSYNTVSDQLHIPPSTPSNSASAYFAMQTGDLNFDGRDELYGISRRAAEDPVSDTRLDILEFGDNGSVARTSQQKLQVNINGGTTFNFETALNLAGRFSAKQSRDIALSIPSTSQIGERDPVVGRSSQFGIVSSTLGLTISGCPGANSAACALMNDGIDSNSMGKTLEETEKLVVLDPDGDGIDEMFKFGTRTIGVADFRGNGRQGLLSGKENITHRRVENGSWVTERIDDAITCYNPDSEFSPRYRTYCAVGDVNGDGASDLVIINMGALELDIWLSTGNGFVQVVDGQRHDGTPILRDLDNNGAIDFISNPQRFHESPYQEMDTLALQFSPAGATVVESPFNVRGSGWSGDFNGDGLPDFVRSMTDLSISNAGTGNPNLLRTIKLQTGGTVSVDYSPSTRWTNAFMPQVMHAVTRMRINDGRGTVATTDYAYAGGLYDPEARKFLGYRTITVTKPLANGETSRPVVTTTYRQDLASYGLPQTIFSRNAANTASKSIAETYSVNATTKPYRALNTATDTGLTEGGITVLLRKERSFDTYGNITQIRDVGRTDLTGDETWTVTSYAENASAYIVSLPSIINVRSGGFNASTAVYEQQQALLYDGASGTSIAPTKGNLTSRRSYKTTSSYSTEAYTYDTNGNMLSQLDGVGNRTEWDYDTAYRLHVIAERAPKYFANGSLAADTRFRTTFTNDLVCGKPASQTDWNGIRETYSYDPFCRPYDTVNAGTGAFVNVRYENEGDPETQAILVSTPPATDGVMEQVPERTFYDGLGRPWSVRTMGETVDGPRRATDTEYDARGNIAQVSLPHFIGDTVQWTVNNYDWQDRLVRTVNPDSSRRVYSHALQAEKFPNNPYAVPVTFTEVSDEEGDIHRISTDKDGNTILKGDTLDGEWVNEFRHYDTLGRLKWVRGPGGPLWTYTYDLQGNRLTARDPDLGSWSYTYNNVGRLISQTDSRAAVTTLTYDQMGRLLTKQARLSGGSAAVLASNTYDTTASGVGTTPAHNVGLLTVSTNPSATYRYSQSLTGTGTISTIQTTIDGVVQTVTDRKGAAGLTRSRSYQPGSIDVGTVAQPWRYNVANRLIYIPGYITATAYRADGQTSWIVYDNGLGTTFTYSEQRGFLTRVLTNKGSTTFLDNRYTRDKLGRIAAINGLTTSDDWTYTYDDMGRLLTAKNVGNSAMTETFAYTASGNLLSRTRMGAYTYPAATAARPHAATKIGTKTLTYDANGNMLRDGTRTLTWSGANQLASVVQSGSTVTFGYGPDGARVKKSWSFGSTLYAGPDVEISRPTSGSQTYTLYPHPDIKITATASGITARSYLHRDHLASVRAVTNSAGALEEKTIYAAYGEPNNKQFKTGKSYIGERYDVETGLTYLNARYYDPAFGRFIPKDDKADEKDGGTQKTVRGAQ